MFYKPKAIIFDIGNVLINWDPDRVYKELLPDPDERARLFKELELEKMNLEVDRGANFSTHIYKHAQKYPNHEALIRAWHDRWIEMASPGIEASWAILRHLKKLGYPVYALTNFGHESYQFARKIYPILNIFDKAFVSGELHTIKPEEDIYIIVETELGLSKADLYFTDDRPENIEAAHNRGWQTHLFTSPEALADDLVAHGILSLADKKRIFSLF